MAGGMGGQPWTPTQRYLFQEEMALAHAPEGLPFNVNMIIVDGRRSGRHVQRVRTGCSRWCAPMPRAERHGELSRSMAILAALALDQEPDERWRNIAAARANIGTGWALVGQAAVQLYGAIGMTDEYKVGHAFKRLTAIDLLFGDADHHIDAIADAGAYSPLPSPYIRCLHNRDKLRSGVARMPWRA